MVGFDLRISNILIPGLVLDFNQLRPVGTKVRHQDYLVVWKSNKRTSVLPIGSNLELMRTTKFILEVNLLKDQLS